MSAWDFDFNDHLRSLLEQIPEGRFSTSLQLAEALGDKTATRAVQETMTRESFSEFREKVDSGKGEVFSGFITDEPLKRLAEYQRSMAERVLVEDDLHGREKVAGVDVSYVGDTAYASCVVMGHDLRILESRSAVAKISFPYIPGYLMFREAPAVEFLLKQTEFEVLMVNGHGAAHPRRCGLASLLGLRLDKPTIGVAERLLVGEVFKGDTPNSKVMYEGNEVGMEITRKGRAPIYVSPGHRVSLETSVEIVEHLLEGGRLPEPLRLAHGEASRLPRNLR